LILKDKNVCILDYGFGNTGSIKNMLKKIGVSNLEVSSNPEVIEQASHLIIPGVGHFDNAMNTLRSKGLDKAIKSFAMSNKPLLGICLGMQILGINSQEGSEQGLELIPFKNVKFDLIDQKVPHMGWNQVEFKEQQTITAYLNQKDRFYFVHSYYAADVPQENVLFMTYYGKEFVSGVLKDNVIGVQFHPEKSHVFGMNFLKGFVGLTNV
jgi:imidazole glycerol-phosphate synthase subunit HisH